MSLEDVKATTGRVLGVDYGEARTGLAVSDASRFLASGIGNVQGGGLEKTAERVILAAREQQHRYDARARAKLKAALRTAIHIACKQQRIGTEGKAACFLYEAELIVYLVYALVFS